MFVFLWDVLVLFLSIAVENALLYRIVVVLFPLSVQCTVKTN